MDYLDIVEVQKLQLINEKAIVSQNDFIRDAYKFDTFLQLGLSSVNGITLLKTMGSDGHGAKIDKQNDSALISRNELPIANIFFKIHHLEKVADGQAAKVLTNQYQELILEELIKKINQFLTPFVKNNRSPETQTFLPYYDQIIDKNLKIHLCEVKTNPLTLAKV